MVLFDQHLKLRGYGHSLRSRLQYQILFDQRTHFRSTNENIKEEQVIPLILPFCKHPSIGSVQNLLAQLNQRHQFKDLKFRSLLAFSRTKSVAQLATRSALTTLQQKVLSQEVSEDENRDIIRED
jgi:F0F1-type ATP synthase delta subunit